MDTRTDPALPFMAEALNEIHEAMMEYGCWPIPALYKSCRVLLDIESYYNARVEARDWDEDFASLWGAPYGPLDDSFSLMERMDKIKERRSDDIKEWIREQGRIVHDHAADLAEQALEDAE